MLDFNQRCNLLRYFRKQFSFEDPKWLQVKQQAQAQNPWFTSESIDLAMKAILDDYLSDKVFYNLERQYGERLNPSLAVKVGLVLAGNIPMVGFHDLLSVFLSGHIALVKLSAKDKVLIPFIVSSLMQTDERVAAQIEFPDQLKEATAFIATGSDNSVRYFESYFGKYPAIIRKNRHAVAILTGQESDEQLIELGKDVFTYFGLGCRNVSKLYVPKNYSFDNMLALWQEHYIDIILHNSYKNNFDYCYTLYLLNKMEFLMNGCILLTRDERLSSRIAMLHYEEYDTIEEIQEKLSPLKDQIQCLVGETIIPEIGISETFGSAQCPGFFDYADGVDTMSFLTQLRP